MTKKATPPDAITLEWFITREDFANDFKRNMRDPSSDQTLWDAFADAVVEQARGGIKHRKTQSAIAGTPRKTTEEMQKRIANAYWEMVENGEKYGAAKALAATYKVSVTTINTYAKKHKKKSIRK